MLNVEEVLPSVPSSACQHAASSRLSLLSPITLATSPEDCNCVANIFSFSLLFFCRQLLCSLLGRQILQDKLRTSLHNGHLELIRKAQNIHSKTHFSSANTLTVFYFLFVVPSVCLRQSRALTQLYRNNHWRTWLLLKKKTGGKDKESQSIDPNCSWLYLLTILCFLCWRRRVLAN